MDDNGKQNYARSLLANVKTGLNVECVSRGINPESLNITVDNEGWALVGWYFSGPRSAWVQAHKFRTKWNNIETSVRVPNDFGPAELWVRVKHDEQ